MSTVVPLPIALFVQEFRKKRLKPLVIVFGDCIPSPGLHFAGVLEHATLFQVDMLHLAQLGKNVVADRVAFSRP